MDPLEEASKPKGGNQRNKKSLSKDEQVSDKSSSGESTSDESTAKSQSRTGAKTAPPKRKFETKNSRDKKSSENQDKTDESAVVSLNLSTYAVGCAIKNSISYLCLSRSLIHLSGYKRA